MADYQPTEQDAEINEAMAAHRRLGADLHTALTRIATLEAACEAGTRLCNKYPEEYEGSALIICLRAADYPVGGEG